MVNRGAPVQDIPQRVRDLPCMRSTAPRPPVLRVSLPRRAADAPAAVQRLLELLVFFPDLTLRWNVDVSMLLKWHLRQYLDGMRRTLEE